MKSICIALATLSLHGIPPCLGITTLTGIFEPDGNVVWSGDLTYTLSRDSRVVVDLGAGLYGEGNNVYYTSHYDIQDDFDPNTNPYLRAQLNPEPSLSPLPGLVPLWDGDNGWDYSWVFGGVAFADVTVYQDPVLPVIPQSFSLSYDQLNLPTVLRFAPGFSEATYTDLAGNRVVFRLSPEAGSAVPEAGNSFVYLGGAILCLLVLGACSGRRGVAVGGARS